MLAACGGHAHGGVDLDAGGRGDSGLPAGSLVQSGVSDAGTGTGTPIAECTKMDIVFVVDDSPSMEEEQANLATNFPAFMNVIEAYRTKSGRELDYRVAVTSTDTFDRRRAGTFARTRGAGAPASCNPGPKRPWLERSDGDVTSAFTCRASLGTDGDTIERPLEALTIALTSRLQDGTNVDHGNAFLRDDALLAFVVITDEDEGGTENSPLAPMSAYATAFDQLKKERARWAAAVIAGEKPCKSQGLGNAAEATNLKEFTDLVGKNAVFSSICQGDLTTGLQAALKTFDQACKEFPVGAIN